MGTAQMGANPITLIFAIIASLYVARWLWRNGDKTSGTEGKEDDE